MYITADQFNQILIYNFMKNEEILRQELLHNQLL